MLGDRIDEQVTDLLLGLQRCREKGLYTDVILYANGEEFSCHKVVLAASSRYFSAMFMVPFSEQQTSRVHLKQISPWALKHLIDFAYSGSLCLSVNTVQDIFIAANLLDYPVAVQACLKFMEKNLDISNCLGVQLLADTYNFPVLADAAKQMAMENFTKITQDSPEWLSLPVASVKAYLASDDLDVRSEQVVLQATLAWIGSDPDTRQDHLLSLLRLVRLHLIPPKALVEVVETSSVLLDCYTASRYVEGFVNRQMLPFLLPTSDDGRLEKLRINARLKNLGTPNIDPEETYDDDHKSSSAVFDYGTDRPPPRPSTVKRDTLVVVGGIDSDILDSVDALSISKRCWIPCGRLPADSLAWFSAVVVNKILVVTGGIRAGSVVSTVYRYSVDDNKWTSGASMLKPRAHHASVAFAGSRVFVFGGVTISSRDVLTEPLSSPNTSELGASRMIPNLSLVEDIDCYDVERDAWTTVGYCSTPRQCSSVAVVKDIEEESSLADVSDDLQALRYKRNAQKYTIIELGGTLDTFSDVVSNRIAIYHVNPEDYLVSASDDYIALMQPVRYAKCAVNQTSKLVYIFWESTGELSVFDFYRQSLRSLKSLNDPPSNVNDILIRTEAPGTRVHCGCVWVAGLLYIIGGFSRVYGSDQQMSAARCDIHSYDPATDTWSEIKVGEPNVPRAVCGCVCLKM